MGYFSSEDLTSRTASSLNSGECSLPVLPIFDPFHATRSLNPDRSAKAGQTQTHLIEEMGLAITAVTERGIRVFFGHCGYCPSDQPF